MDTISTPLNNFLVFQCILLEAWDHGRSFVPYWFVSIGYVVLNMWQYESWIESITIRAVQRYLVDAASLTSLHLPDGMTNRLHRVLRVPVAEGSFTLNFVPS